MRTDPPRKQARRTISSLDVKLPPLFKIKVTCQFFKIDTITYTMNDFRTEFFASTSVNAINPIGEKTG